MSETIKIDQCVFQMWVDFMEPDRHIDVKIAGLMIAQQFEIYSDAVVIGYDLLRDLYYVTPESFTKQWNWLVDNQPETYQSISSSH